RRYFAALAVLLALCGLYALAVGPLIAPPPIIRREPATVAPPEPALAILPEVQADLERLFSPAAWERQNPKIIETEQCTLLLQEYEPLPDGRLKLTPCTLIFRTTGGAEAGGGPPARR